MLFVLSKRAVSPQIDTGGEVENDARFEIAYVHSERKNGLRHQYPKWTRAKNCGRTLSRSTLLASTLGHSFWQQSWQKTDVHTRQTTFDRVSNWRYREKKGNSMQKMTQRFLLFGKKGNLLALICVLGFGFFQVISVPTASARAVNTGSDPSVIIVVDDTANSGCTKSIEQGIGTAHESVTTQVCSPATILDTRIVKKSAAIAQNDAYVLLPPKNASVAILKQTVAAVQKLRNSKKASLQSGMSPLSCSTGQVTLHATGYPGNGAVSALVYINYYKNGCNGIFIDNVSEEGITVPNDTYYANQDFYASDYFGWWNFYTGCPSVNNHYWISMTLDRSEPYGDYYVAGWLDVALVNDWCSTWAGGNWYESQSSFLLN